MRETKKYPRAGGQEYLNAFRRFHSDTNTPAGLHGILDRLQQVRPNGPDSYTAICPVHDDKSPSLTIKDTGDKVLIHCFAGCDNGDIMAAIGLELRDLFNESLPPQQRRERATRANRRDLEAALDHELTVIAMTLGQRVLDRQQHRDSMPDGWKAMPADHWNRELQSARRILRLIPRVYDFAGVGHE